MKGLINFEPGRFYHLVNHVVGFENLFRSDENFHFFLRRYAHYMPSVCDTYAYCLMPNHIHFLIKTHSEEKLSKHPKFKGDYHKVVMQEWSNLLNSYAKAYNKMYKRRGALWIDFSKRFLIDSDEYLMSCINYIHHNPIKHGFCEDAADWKFSSFNSLFSEKETFLNRKQTLLYFGGIEQFINYHKTSIAIAVDDWEW